MLGLLAFSATTYFEAHDSVLKLIESTKIMPSRAPPLFTVKVHLLALRQIRSGVGRGDAFNGNFAKHFSFIVIHDN